MAPCLVCLFDCFREWFNPKSIRKGPPFIPCCCGCCGCGKSNDCHDAYYSEFLKSSSLGSNAGTVRLTEQDLLSLKADLLKFINENNCGPILIRLAWHDSGTYDQRLPNFPQRGGANGAIIFGPEINMGANAGLTKAVKYLDTFKTKYPMVGWADIIQMASACAVEHMGGPVIEMKYGRKSITGPEQCAGPREGFAGNAGLPDAKPGPDGKFGSGATDPATHLRDVFTKKMGFNDEEIVALSGAHTIGRAFKDRSGTCPFDSMNPAKYTTKDTVARHDGKSGVGMAGGQSWAKQWLKFDNGYFTQGGSDDGLIWLPTDQCLTEDRAFKPIFEKFKGNQAAFFASYASAHKKLSELGSDFGSAAITMKPSRFGGEALKKEDLQSLKADLLKFINENNCGPILIRLAWHDSGTYDQRLPNFPQRGGANGAIIFGPEINMGANAGLTKAVKYLDTFKTKYPLVGWADIIQMASACAVEHMGGPVIKMKYGRKSITGPEQCAGPREGFAGNAGLPDAKPGPDGKFGSGATDPATHLRDVFTKKMGFNDEEIVALSGAHTIGRAFKDRSGTCPFDAMNPAKYTTKDTVARHDGKSGVGMAGGQSWAKQWLKFDNGYFTQGGCDDGLIWLPTDQCLTEDLAFKPIFEKFKGNQPAFFASYANAHKKLSELGSDFGSGAIEM